MFETLQLNNSHMQLFHVNDPLFKRYGNVVSGYDFTPWIDIMQSVQVPAEGNIYVANDQTMLDCKVSSDISTNMYGGMPVQVGYCNGNGKKLNALEYHKSSEINIAVTDLVLLLGDVRDIENNTYSSSNVQGFYIPVGTACEIYATTLHFAPCKVFDSGFKCIVVLPLHTNEPLDLNLIDVKNNEDRLLWMRNKWLIAHPESIPASKGALSGIYGDNLELV